MASRPGDRHAKEQLNIRVPAGDLARIKDAAGRHGQTQADIMIRGALAEVDRLDGIATTPGGYTQPAEPAAFAAEDEQPRRPQHALTCKCGICRPKK